MSADRYEIIDDGTSIIIAESNGIRSSIDPVDGQHLDDIVICAIRQQSADIAELRAELNRERETNAVLRRDLAEPPPDIQELALKKCGHFEIVAKLRADLAAAVAERDGLGDYRSEFEPIWDGLQDALEGERQINNYGLGESEVECVRRVLRERDILRARLAAIDNAPTIARLISRGEDSRRYSYMPFECARTYAEFPKTAAADVMWREGLELIARPAKDSP